MKNSGVEWIGEIPEDWEVKRGKELFFEINDRCKNSENYPLLSVSEYYGVAPKSEKIDEGDFITHAETLDGYKICQEGDIVQNIMLAWKRATGMSNYEGLISPAYCIYRPFKDVDSKYYHYLFRTDVYADLFKQFSTGIIDSRLRLYPAKFLSLKYAYPPKSTQQRIASYLDKKCSKIEETIQNQQQVIEKLKAYKQSLITEAVTGKIKIQNGKVCGKYESYKDSGVEWIGKIPKGWEVIKLKFSSQIMRGLFSHRPRNDPDYYDGVHPFIQTGEVARAVKYITTYSQTLNELGFSVSREFPAGTVLLTIAANVGDVAILDFNACFPDSVIGFYPKENVSKIFMFYVLKSMKEQFMRNAIISTQMNLNINIVKEEFIPLPSLAEQKEIVKFLEKKSDYIDTAIQQKQKLIEKLTEYKKSLIYECVTGKKAI